MRGGTRCRTAKEDDSDMMRFIGDPGVSVAVDICKGLVAGKEGCSGVKHWLVATRGPEV